MFKKLFISTATICLVFNINSWAQITVNQINGSNANPITTAVPFLNITPDARGGAMGDVGVATTPDVNSTYWNAAKLAFIDKGYGGAVSYNPWLRKLVNDMALSYLSGYLKIRKEEVVALSLTYFDLGSIQFTDAQGNNLTKFSPNEFALSGTYSRKLSQSMGVAVSLKYIYSNLAGSISTSSGTEPASAAQSAAADVGYFFTKPLSIKGTKNNLAIGANISNVGAKISYSNESQKDFIPSNLRVGSSFTHEIDPYNKVVLSVDLNKLMVPSPPIYGKDSKGNTVIVSGKAPSDGVISGILGSFSDAPGGFSEEMKEITISSGLEYWYNNLFAIRTGYFNESKMKGNRKYMTAGIGLKYQVFTLDVAYLVPFEQNNPLAETLRFSLSFNFEKATESVKE
jgi:hypothetical protein